MPERLFPPPWTVEDYNNACFVVKDCAGRALAYAETTNPQLNDREMHR
jgi:hypothetical protein